ncbi:MAG TPA: ABC transporter permease [Thermoanaerobaculia bacterium]|nr:ABC transporter permease [Thermoanaerobaculia bacterium]
MGEDLRFSLRALARTPGFTLTAVLTLGLGIGCTAAVFSVVDAIVLRPLPYADAGRLVEISESLRSGRGEPSAAPVSVPDFIALRERVRGVERLSAIYPSKSVQLAGAGEPLKVEAALVTHDLFPLLGRRAMAGRAFVAADERPGAEPVVLLGEGFWRQRCGADPGLVGRALRLDGRPTTVVGILPDDFHFPSSRSEIWLPLVLHPGDPVKANPWARILRVVGRLGPGTTMARARQELAGAAAQLGREIPQADKDLGLAIEPLEKVIVGDVARPLWLLLGAAAGVLLIACLNVVNLFLLRALGRQHDVAVCTALGAGAPRVLGQFLIESLALALLGGALGSLLAWWAVRLFVLTAGPGIPRLEEVRLEVPALGVALAVSLLIALALALAATLSVYGTDLHQLLRIGARGTGGVKRRRVRAALVVGELALAVVLLIGTGLMTNSLIRLFRVDPGFRPHGVLTMKLTVTPAAYPGPGPIARFFDQVLQRLAAVPGVASAGMVSELPLAGDDTFWNFVPEGRPLAPGQEPGASYRLVGGDYFRAVGMPLVRGRLLDGRDRRPGAGAAVVNQAMARRFWPGEDPIGRRFRLGALGAPGAPPAHPWMTIAGVVGDVRHHALGDPAGPEMFLPFSLADWAPTMVYVIRGRGDDPAALAASLRAAVWQVDPGMPVYDVRTLDEVVSGSLAGRRFNLVLMSVFAGIALLLANLGIYGVMAQAVAQQRQSIAIQMALGAARQDVLLRVLRQGLAVTLTGLALGLLLALGTTRLVSSLLYGVTATDPLTFAAVAALLVVVALATISLPAHRATRIDPMQCLKEW